MLNGENTHSIKERDLMADNKRKEILNIGARISTLQRIHRRFISSYLSKHDLSGAMHMILSSLHSKPGVSQDYLSVRFNMDKGIVARQCKILESRNLIRREINDSDHRQYCLYLTEDGEALIPEIYNGYQEWTDMICKDFTDEEIEAACQLLTRMVQNCNDLIENV
jgi:DNA-binding MarR family transcriptional regulator